MVEVNVAQGSEEWHEARRGRATASQFHRIITPAQAKLSKSHAGYAAEVAMEQMGIYESPPLPTYDMQLGTEREPIARRHYAEFFADGDVREAGFCVRDAEETRWGGSPDGFVGDDGLVEIKCPKPATLLEAKMAGTVPQKYLPQIRGLMLICKRSHCDFFMWHPQMAPFHKRVERCPIWEREFLSHMDTFLGLVEQIKERYLSI